MWQNERCWDAHSANTLKLKLRVPCSTRRPSDIVGDEDNFYNNLIMQCKWRAAVPLVDGGKVRLQPTYVSDVAQAVMKALELEESKGKIYNLAGAFWVLVGKAQAQHEEGRGEGTRPLPMSISPCGTVGNEHITV